MFSTHCPIVKQRAMVAYCAEISQWEMARVGVMNTMSIHKKRACSSLLSHSGPRCVNGPRYRHDLTLGECCYCAMHARKVRCNQVRVKYHFLDCFTLSRGTTFGRVVWKRLQLADNSYSSITGCILTPIEAFTRFTPVISHPTAYSDSLVIIINMTLFEDRCTVEGGWVSRGLKGGF